MLKSRGRAARGTQAAPKLHSVQLDGATTIHFELRRSARRTRTIHIRVEGDRVILAVPVRTPLSEAEDIIRKRERWILDHIARKPAPPPQLLVDGCDKLPFMGWSVSVVVEPAVVKSAAARLGECVLRVDVPAGLDDGERGEAARNAVVEWLRGQAAERLQVEVERWWPTLGRGEQARIRIGNQRRQWANCSANGAIRFSWRVMMLAPELIEYVVVHEMAHLTRMDHSKEFWAIVAWAMPDAADRRKALEERCRTSCRCRAATTGQARSATVSEYGSQYTISIGRPRESFSGCAGSVASLPRSLFPSQPVTTAASASSMSSLATCFRGLCHRKAISWMHGAFAGDRWHVQARSMRSSLTRQPGLIILVLQANLD